MMQPPKLSQLLDKIYGISHNYRVFYGRISKTDQLLYLGMNLGSSMLCLNEEEGVILVLKKCQHGSFKLKSGAFKAIARVNINTPSKSRYDGAPKPVRSEIINFLHSNKTPIKAFDNRTL